MSAPNVVLNDSGGLRDVATNVGDHDVSAPNVVLNNSAGVYDVGTNLGNGSMRASRRRRL